jgi:hypothetical protein
MARDNEGCVTLHCSLARVKFSSPRHREEITNLVHFHDGSPRVGSTDVPSRGWLEFGRRRLRGRLARFRGFSTTVPWRPSALASHPPRLVGGEKERNPCDVLRLADPPYRLAWVWRAGRRRGEAGISEARARPAGAIVAPLAGGQHGQRAREARGWIRL